MDAKEYSLYDNNNNYANNNNQDSDDLGLNAAPINIDIDTPKNIYPLEDQYPNPSDFPQYNKITNSNQPSDFFELNHKGITQINENTFYIKRKWREDLRTSYLRPILDPSQDAPLTRPGTS